MNRLSRSISWIIAASAVGQGIGVFIGGPTRWSGPAYVTAMQFPGAPGSWAWVLVIFGTLATIGLLGGHYGDRWAFWVKAAGLFGIASWCTAFGGAAVWNVHTVPNAGTTAIGAYLPLAAIVALMIFTRETTHAETLRSEEVAPCGFDAPSTGC